MLFVGINPGNGHTKAVQLDLQGHETIMPPFPSLISAAGKKNDWGENVPVVTVGEQDLWVGAEAELGNAVTTTTRERLDDSLLIPSLTAAVVQRLPFTEPGIVGTCLPATWAESRELKMALAARIREGAGPLVAGVTVVSEPAAAALSVALDSQGRPTDDSLLSSRLAVIDIGYRTTDGLALDQMRQDGPPITLRSGMMVALTQLLAAWERDFDMPLTLGGVDMALRNRALRVGGAEHPLPSGWQIPLVRLAETIVSQIRNVWGSGRQFSSILLAGGGAAEPELVKVLKGAFPHARSLPDPQNAIARGCARRAAQQGKQEGRHTFRRVA